MIMFQTRILGPVSLPSNIGLINIISFMFGETRPFLAQDFLGNAERDLSQA